MFVTRRRNGTMLKIIVFQSNEDGMELVRMATQDLRRSNIIMMDRLDTFLIHNLIDPSARTLFITGTVHGQPLQVIQFAEELCERYHGSVKCLGFASVKLPNPPFYKCIVKDRSGGTVNALRVAIEEFLNVPVLR
jgi:hypothetical protein